MIALFYEIDFKIDNESLWKKWVNEVVKIEGYKIQEINYIFCDDEYLLRINKEFLKHDYYTDVIGFQSSNGKSLSGDIFISIDRIKENAEINEVTFLNELARVMIHGILHFMGHDDATNEEHIKMRKAEDKYLALFDELN